MHIKRTENTFIFAKENTDRNDVVCILVFLLAVILKFGYYRFSYFPILDDYIQYGAYQLYPEGYVLFQTGTVYTRPLAAICDVYLWGRFGDNMSIVFVIITAMHFVSAFLFKRAFKDINIYLGNVFLIFYLISPILTEAVYWISASARIVPGLLFCALSMNFLSAYLKSKKAHMWILAFLTHLISYGFYEQTAVMSFIVFLFFTLVYSYRENGKNISAFLVPVICAGAFLIYYIIFRDMGNNAGRTAINLSTSHMLATAKRLIRIAVVQSTELTAKGFLRGFNLLIGKPLYLAFVTLSSTLFLFLTKERFKVSLQKLLMGVLILTIPFFPYFILENSYPEFRSMHTAIIGTGFILDAVLGKFKYKNILCFILAFVFISANVSEIHDYKSVYDIDQRILGEISASDNLTEHTDIYVTGAKEHYTEVNSRLGAHISSITSSDWALTGAVRAYTKNADIKRLIPVLDSGQNLAPTIDISHIK